MTSRIGWPTTPAELIAAQRELAALAPPPWTPPDRPLLVAGCFVCFPRGYAGSGAHGDPAWAAAVVVRGRRRLAGHVATGAAAGPYEAGLLALREGWLLEGAVRGLLDRVRPDVLLVNATGRDHPRRAGLALHLGAVLDLPTVGVTHRTLCAQGEWPPDSPGAVSPLRLDDEVVGHWLRTRAGTRPVAVHAGWRIDAGMAVAVVRRIAGRHRTPEPLRQARWLARAARAAGMRDR